MVVPSGDFVCFGVHFGERGFFVTRPPIVLEIFGGVLTARCGCMRIGFSLDLRYMANCGLKVVSVETAGDQRGKLYTRCQLSEGLNVLRDINRVER